MNLIRLLAMPRKIQTHCTLSALLCTVSLSLPTTTLAQTPNEQLIQQQQQRDQFWQQQRMPQPDGRIENPSIPLPNPSISNTKSTASADANQAQCFAIQSVHLTGVNDTVSSADIAHFQPALRRALRQVGFVAGNCWGEQHINQLMVTMQNDVIGRGYTTTRILAAPQNLSEGTLVLAVLPGKVRSVRFEQKDAQEHTERITAFHNEFPIRAGELLNLRKIEQGLENLKRVPTAQTDIQIVPTEQLGESDIVVSWQQRTVPFRLTLSADDSGSKSTGRYQGNVTFSADNPLGLSDLFYISYGRALGHVPSQKGTDERREKGASQNFALHYSVPFGNWLWSFNHQNYRYHQAVAGNYTVYDYNGKSRSSDLGVSRLLYRDAKRKTHVGFKLWQRENSSYIDDAEIEVQHRKTAGWAASLSHKEYWGKATLDAQINYKRGTGMQDALPAPEELFNEGSSRMKIWTADIGLNLPMGKQGKWTLDSRWHGQWNKTPLTPLDRLAIGGRYTVRGFDGEMSLSAERGWYWRNELAWQYHAGHQIYAALDAGHVAGASAQYLVGKNLMGAAIGVRGQFQKGLNYDIFAAKPIHKPQYFHTANKVYGFNVSWTF